MPKFCCFQCANRAVGCRADCPTWAAHVEERKAVYERRRLESVASMGLCGSIERHLKNEGRRGKMSGK